MNQLSPSTPPESFGRYVLYPAIAHGGMATVHTARLVGADGFSRLVAAKRLHPQLLDDPDFVTMFHDEACIASRIHHPNVVPVLDVVVAGNELILVQEYVHGVPLSLLLKAAVASRKAIPTAIVAAVVSGVLAGLHAAHEVKDEEGHPLEIIHRDVSPQNVMVSVDGIPRLLDFGIAKARTSTHHTREGVFKGKLAYMAPEQLRMDPIDRSVDLYATGVMAWELLTNGRIYDGRNELAFVTTVMKDELPSVLGAVSTERGTMDEARWRDLEALAPVIARAMSNTAADRFATAAEMMTAILAACTPATSHVVAQWVLEAGSEFLGLRQKALAANEDSYRKTSVFPITAPASGIHPAGTPNSFAPFTVAMRGSAPPSSVPPSSVPPASSDRSSNLPAANDYELQHATPLYVSSGSFRMTPDFWTRVRAMTRDPQVWPWIAAASTALAFMLVYRTYTLLSVADDQRPARAMTSFTVGGAAGAGPSGARGAAPIGEDFGAPGALAAAPSVQRAGTPPATASTPGAGAGLAPVAAASPVAPSLPAPQAPPPAPVQQRWTPRWVAPAPVHAPPPVAAPAGDRATSRAQASEAPASPKADCSPPFYFEGSKKIFKPSCL